MRVVFFGDPHGDFRAFHAEIRARPVDLAVFVGDFDLDRPLEEEAADLLSRGGDLAWVTGNHDTDQDHWHDFLFESALADRNINGRVVEAGGLRIAGLGGVFRAGVWHPKDGSGEPKWRRRQDYLDAHKNALWRGGVPRQHRSSIWPEDLDALADMQADVLVTHEAPSSHEYGFEMLDTLAEVMGVHTIVHGHLHQAYEATLANGVRVVDLAKAGVYEWPSDRAAAA